MPAQPGRMPSACTVPVAASTGAARPDADADHARDVDARLGEHVGGEPLREVEAGERVLVDRRLGSERSARILPPRSQTAARTWRCPKSSPTANAAIGRERDLQRRAADHAALVG